MFDFFLKRGANIWKKGSINILSSISSSLCLGCGGSTALHDAASEGHIEIVRSILRTRPSKHQLNIRDKGEMTALGCAITGDRLKIVRLLLKYSNQNT